MTSQSKYCATPAVFGFADLLNFPGLTGLFNSYIQSFIDTAALSLKFLKTM